MTNDVFIYDAVRTPRGKGKPGAPMSVCAPHELVVQLIDALDVRSGGTIRPAVERLVLSCVGQTGAQGGHIGLVSKLAAGLRTDAVAHSVNNYCVGGMTAIGQVAAAIRSGDCSMGLAGGVEMMSHVPFLSDRATIYSDPDVAGGQAYAPPGIGADVLATEHGVGRDELDAMALRSHQRASAAWSAGRYARSVVAVTGPDGAVALDRDETILADASLEKFASLAPVFAEMGEQRYDTIVRRHRPEIGPISHVHTIAHCPPIADGASLAVLGTESAGAEFGLTPLARVVDVVEAGGDSIRQLTAGVAAMEKLLTRQALDLESLDLLEYMEAFAVVPALLERSQRVDPSRVNVNGGHLAMGHPMGATGAILTTALAWEMNARSADTGLAVAHGGTGVGAAVLLSAP